MSGQEVPLPTVGEAQALVRVVNNIRGALGMDAIEYLDYDGAVPGGTCECISAKAFGCSDQRESGPRAVSYKYPNDEPVVYLRLNKVEEARLVAERCGLKLDNEFNERAAEADVVLVPEATPVTRAFDCRISGLRERLVEAGVVRPKEDPSE